MTDSQHFRANVGIVVVGPDNRVLAFERRMQGQDCNSRSNAWQFPQGGLEPGEEPSTAWRRELAEETNIQPEQVELLFEYPGWLAYELPPSARRSPAIRGQVQKWFFVRLWDATLVDPLAAARAHGLEPEFCRHEWITMEEAVQRVWSAKQPIYRQLQRHLEQHLGTMSNPEGPL